MNLQRQLIITLLTAPLVCAAFGAPESQKDIDNLVRDILSGATGNAESARRLYMAASKIQGDAETKELLLEKAVEYSVDRGGSRGVFAIAEKSLDMMSELRSDGKLELIEKRCQLYEKWYRLCSRRKERREIGQKWLGSEIDLGQAYTADKQWSNAVRKYRRAGMLAKSLGDTYTLEILQEHIRRVSRMQQIQAKVQNLQRALKKNPDKVNLRENIIMTYVAELNDPASALKYLRNGIDEVLATYVPLAAKDKSQLSESVCLELGRWYYKTLYKEAHWPGSRAAILRRAHDYYTRYLELHRKKDAGALRAAAQLSEINEELKKYNTESTLKDFLRMVKVVSAGYECGNIAKILLKDKLILSTEHKEGGENYRRGINMVVWRDGKVIKTGSYDSYISSKEATEFAEVVKEIPQGAFVVIAVKDEATKHFNTDAYQAIRSIGGETDLGEAPFRCSYFCIGQKGLAPGKAVEKMKADEMLGYPPDFISKIRKEFR